MKKCFVYLTTLCLLPLLFIGCDWSSGGDSNTYNARYNWANFSGVYRPISGRYIVTNFSQGTPALPGTPESSFVEQRSEQVATGNGSRTTFNGSVSRRAIVPGTFTLATAGFNLTDDGSGVLVGSGASGTIEYTTGGWSVDFGGFAPDNGSAITARYSHTVTTTIVPGTDARPPGPGSTGFELFSFSVAQGGENLSLTDNTGREYKGKMGSIRSTRGDSRDTPSDTAAPIAGDQIIGLFNASGVSPAGINVRMTGTFQAVVGAGGQLTNRVMLGTWIEDGGKSGDINGQAGPIAIDTSTIGGN